MANDSQIQMRPFSELLERVVDNRGKTCPTSETGIPLIATNCIRNENLYPSYEKVRYVSQETYQTWFRGHPEPGDIIFVNKGTPGRTCLVPDPIDFCIAQDMVAVRANQRKVDQQYLFAALRSPQVQISIANMHVGTLIPHFKKGDFQRLLIPVPCDASIQKAIGHIYLSFSEKIELNRQMNRTLEKMAQAIFKSWFIDFDPVRAKADGRDPGLPKEIADLFPDSFKDSELGPIPKGWKVKALDKIAEYFNGLACQKYPAVSGESSLPVIKIRELRQGISSKTDRATPNVPEKFLVSNGDVLFSWSGSLLVDVWTGGPGVLNQHVFKVTSNAFPKWFYFLWTTHHLKEFQKIAADKATTMGHIKRHHLSDAKVVVPPQAIMDAANGQMKPLFESQLDNSRQALQLERTRDTLLPKLISGKLHIPDAEKLVEDLNRNGDSNGKS